MTHLTDGSYNERAVGLLAALVFMIYIVWERDRLRTLNPFRTKYRMKCSATWLLILSAALMLVYDLMASYFKYQEGFVRTKAGNVLPKPVAKYSLYHQDLVTAANSLLNVSWTFKSSALFLSLAVWNFSVCSLLDFKFFTKSWEFKIYSFYSGLSFFLYPLLQYAFIKNPLYSTVTPQIVYHSECILLSLLFIYTNIKFNKFVGTSASSSQIKNRIRKYIRNNTILTVIIFLDGLSLLIINIDILTTDRVIYNNKFATDFLTALFSHTFYLAYPFAILNLYPNSTVEKELTAPDVNSVENRDSRAKNGNGGRKSGKSEDKDTIKNGREPSSLAQTATA